MIYYSEALIDRPRKDVMHHLLHENLSILTVRRIRSDTHTHFGVSQTLVGKDAVSMLDSCVVFPLYLYPNGDLALLIDSTDTVPWQPDPDHGNRVPNLAPAFVQAVEAKLDLTFQHPASSNQTDAFTPEDLLAYIYAIFHSPTYRERYAEFLKIDFPRAPITSDAGTLLAARRLGPRIDRPTFA